MPPRVLRTRRNFYLAYRPDAELDQCYPEIVQLSRAWVRHNVLRNAGDLPRLYAFILNTRQVLDDNVPGDMAELGVYRGNSAAVLAYYARKYGRKLLLFDTFGGFDAGDLTGVDSEKPREFADTSIATVREIVGADNVEFVIGRFPQSLRTALAESRFCLVHLDCDLYEPAKAGLEFFYPRLSPGGLIVVHDYANPYWAGIKAAVDEYCAGIPEKPVVFGDKAGTAMIRKVAEP